ncbi:hypothetical protein BDV98DRAFT_499797 [Pterulicium gracile]|uniref:UBC core domain-containing protein n=1 Tax=Pterulicium gracile TaxID=1884261 RepID=A0A5C3QVL3_9AGAR|nr:hypothetical protein BDV98DRAFT_499797 [Pterula gracilis]
MESQVQQLVEMGASVQQARAALAKYKDVMEAAERIFDGQFDDLPADDPPSSSNSNKPPPQSSRYFDYDSDFETTNAIGKRSEADPYAGIFFSKSRREEVIEVEEEPELTTGQSGEPLRLMTQGQWMKGCPEGSEQSFLFSLYTQLSEGECRCPSGCSFSVRRRKSDFFCFYPDFTTYIDNVRKNIQKICPSCKVQFCVACGESSHERADRPGVASGGNPMFHCSNLQGVILGMGLTMLEQVFFEQQTREGDGDDESRTAKKRRIEVKPTSTTPDDYDDEYAPLAGGKKQKGGIGYAGGGKEDTTGQIEAQAMQRAKDEKLGQLLSTLREYLPSLHREGGGQTSDFLVHPTALAHLRRRFNHVCSSLLRNDSLTDMSERSVLYFELMEWLEIISNHEALASMMAMPIMVVVSTKAVSNKRSPGRPESHIRERTIVYEGSSGPRELLETIAIQARAALKGLEGLKRPETPQEEMTEEQKRMTVSSKGKEREIAAPMYEENRRLVDFCRRILSTVNAIDRSLRETKGDQFVDRLHASLPKISSDPVFESLYNASEDDDTTEKTYVDWATRVRFQYCDLSIPQVSTATDAVGEDDFVPHYKFYYNNEARVLANSDIPKRSLAISKELAVLTTNLPVAWNSSIFLRVDESRVDIIKAMIVGPEGTPYQNGCYLFDIFLGPSYNQSPPSVKYMTTNGGKFRFNPNLYADGKVCLSLLGTWQGPGWVSGRSTLLQVLISIQSMILCDEPYLNEPGWAASAGTPQSKAYSKNIRRMVVHTAMLGSLSNPPEPFGDIIRTHFKLKAKSLSLQLDEWLAEDDGKSTTDDGGGYGGTAGSSMTSFKKDCQELKLLLQKLQTGQLQTGDGIVEED